MGYYTSLTFEERFFRRVVKRSGVYPNPEDPLVDDRVRSSECWMWSGGYNSNGYPRYNCKVPGMGTIPYRISWKILVGDIEDTLDHLCRNPGCVNPEHLEDVSPKENALRSDNPPGRNARKTHCIRGHPFNGENLLIRPTGHRTCRECSRVSSAAHYQRRKDLKQEGEQSI